MEGCRSRRPRSRNSPTSTSDHVKYIVTRNKPQVKYHMKHPYGIYIYINKYLYIYIYKYIYRFYNNSGVINMCTIISILWFSMIYPSIFLLTALFARSCIEPHIVASNYLSYEKHLHPIRFFWVVLRYPSVLYDTRNLRLQNLLCSPIKSSLFF